jgi:hypothetical protein
MPNHEENHLSKTKSMSLLQIKTNPEVEAVFVSYPDAVKEKVLHLRELILKTAEETDGIDSLEETLKWGEPSYLTKHGSTVRVAWKAKTPDQYAVYFKCTSKLVPTFREVFCDAFAYEDNRAIIFNIADGAADEQALKSCIKAALTYHRVKHMPLLGI